MFLKKDLKTNLFVACMQSRLKEGPRLGPTRSGTRAVQLLTSKGPNTELIRAGSSDQKFLVDLPVLAEI